MTRIHSFSPIAAHNARILILGSMPGRASLQAHQYYAHPQNSFWRIMSQLLQMAPDVSYDERVELVKSARIAVWDVLQSCIREGSLDSSIERDTLIANDFRRFFQTHKKITHVFFNGAKAETCFVQHVLGEIEHIPLNLVRLPSTSPANASTTFAGKLEAWRAILPPINSGNDPLLRTA
jgi:hypoxanthine-DNA glycosylase